MKPIFDPEAMHAFADMQAHISARTERYRAYSRPLRRLQAAFEQALLQNTAVELQPRDLQSLVPLVEQVSALLEELADTEETACSVLRSSVLLTADPDLDTFSEGSLLH